MSLLETLNFLARVYTDANLRREFLSAPERIGKENALTAEEICEIVEIFPDEINAFAESLFWKRLREVEKLLPLTRRSLNAEFERLFREFSPDFNPPSIKKHLEDALCFGRFLQKSAAVSELAKNAAKFEGAKLEFYAVHKNFIVRYFDFDIQTGERKKHFKIWLRIGKREVVF
ncbi:MAG: hypothetical protein LH472_16525 [Pyrinomonadaceae bacterium]|nr:hypothetical protein [Pyrinomonadaceae bacterium]